jgi:hypothetical protein
MLPASSTKLRMSSTTPTTTNVNGEVSTDFIVPRVRAADAASPSEGPVVVKGWVKTLRKQKTLAFVEVTDGSNLNGIQCVVSFDSIDDATRAGRLCGEVVMCLFACTCHT